MSDTLPNSGPLETGRTPAEENLEDSQIADINISVIIPSTVSAPPVLPAPHPRRKKKTLRIVIPLLLLALSGTIISAALAINFGIGAYTTYTTLRSEAYDGIQHLLNVKTVFTGLKIHPTGFLDLGKLHLAQKEFSTAHKDFQQVQYTLDHAAVIDTVVHYFPQYSNQVTTTRALSQIGIEVTNIGQELIHAATILAPSFREPLLNATNKPLVTPAMLELVRTTIDNILPMLSDIQTHSHKFSLEALPANISAHQRAQLVQLLQLLPQAQADLVQARNLLDAAGWMLGVNEPRTFLVQTMDRAELRPTGGFTGQYGELSINGGRVAPFSLRDISLVEYVDNSPTLGVVALPQYRSWWPFANWGLRDSNLSADFPTSAQIDRSTTHDGLYVVQANISASKASQYVRTIMHDTVTLNADGGATHLMQLRLVYNQLGPVYGYDTYHDYVRVYVPPTSKYLWGDGFDTGIPLCGAFYS